MKTTPYCAWCRRTATTLITAKGYAAQACPHCLHKARKEAARAGPPTTETPIGDQQEQTHLF